MGTLVEPSLLPCVGLGAYDTTTAGTLSIELQLYAEAAQGWAIVQQRSPPATGRHAQGSLFLVPACCAVSLSGGKKNKCQDSVHFSHKLLLECRQEAFAASFADFVVKTGVSQVRPI